uniref:NADH dehydrogenase [ubiquinone] 1 beta subcomplex subunit 9 n=1 Tax=Nelumbo nucifera TaxID=4432 RepID=A0A822ZBL8_NELNU|nr:TPA_asm: hypothetical protein HUJ06_014759 [Nelumbo nucifera]
MSASYLARRAAQKERVRILYRRALKDTLNWAVHRHLFYQDASGLREKFEANKHVVCSLESRKSSSFIFLMLFLICVSPVSCTRRANNAYLCSLCRSGIYL